MIFKNCKFIGISKPPEKLRKRLKTVSNDAVFEDETFYVYKDEFYTWTVTKPWWKIW